MTDFRIEARLGNVSFACDPDQFDRQLAVHLVLARRAGWDGEAVVREIPAVGGGSIFTQKQIETYRSAAAKRQAQRSAKARAKWERIARQATDFEHAVRLSRCTRPRVMQALRDYGLTPSWPIPKNGASQSQACRRRWEDAIAASATLEDVLDAMGCTVRAADRAAARYGLTLPTSDNKGRRGKNLARIVETEALWRSAFQNARTVAEAARLVGRDTRSGYKAADRYGLQPGRAE